MFTCPTVQGLKKQRVKSDVYVFLLRKKYSFCLRILARASKCRSLRFQQNTLLALVDSQLWLAKLHSRVLVVDES